MSAPNLICLMVVNATFSNISVISCRSDVLVEETGGPGENHRPVVSHRQTLSHNVVHLALIEIRTHNIIGEMHWLQIQLPYDHGHDSSSYLNDLTSCTALTYCWPDIYSNRLFTASCLVNGLAESMLIGETWPFSSSYRARFNSSFSEHSCNEMSVTWKNVSISN